MAKVVCLECHWNVRKQVNVAAEVIQLINLSRELFVSRVKVDNGKDNSVR